VRVEGESEVKIYSFQDLEPHLPSKNNIFKTKISILSVFKNLSQNPYTSLLIV